MPWPRKYPHEPIVQVRPRPSFYSEASGISVTPETILRVIGHLILWTKRTYEVQFGFVSADALEAFLIANFLLYGGDEGQYHRSGSGGNLPWNSNLLGFNRLSRVRRQQKV